jgi:hypothetical protein
VDFGKNLRCECSLPGEIMIEVDHNNLNNKIAFYICVVVLIIVIWLIWGSSATRKTVDAESLIVYTNLEHSSFQEIWTKETYPDHFITYRPLYLSILKIEYLIFGLSPVVFTSTNVLVFSGLVILIFSMIYRTTKQIIPALLPALFFITDWRNLKEIYSVPEVQTIMAGFFGLSALWFLWFGREKRYRLLLIFLFLLAAPLCKEYGLAFALAAFISAIMGRNKDNHWKKVLVVSLSVVVIYVSGRLLLGLVPASTREYSSFLNMMKWMVANISSGFIFSFIPLFLTKSDGDFPSIENLYYAKDGIWVVVLLQVLPIIVLFIYGMKEKKYHWISIPLFFLILGNSFLFFFKYAYRFHFNSTIGIIVVMGFGIASILDKYGSKIPATYMVMVIMLFTSIVYWRGTDASDFINELVRINQRQELCIPPDEYYTRENFDGFYTPISSTTVQSILSYYDMPMERCNCFDPKPVCK